MPALLRIKLNEEEDRTLKELSYADGVPTGSKQRAMALSLNAHGWKVQQIASYLNWHEPTVRATLKRWQQNGLGGLWERSGRGRKRS